MRLTRLLWPAALALLFLIALLALAAFGLMFVPAKEGAIPGRKETLATGLAAGVLTGFASMPGPPVVPFYLRRKLSPDVARASMLMVFFATAIAGSIAAFALGVANLHLLWLSVLFYPALYIGTRLGELAFGKEYVIPKPMDARLLPRVARAVALAAVASGVARIELPADYMLE